MTKFAGTWPSWRVVALVAVLIAVFGGYTIFHAATYQPPGRPSPSAPASMVGRGL